MEVIKSTKVIRAKKALKQVSIPKTKEETEEKQANLSTKRLKTK